VVPQDAAVQVRWLLAFVEKLCGSMTHVLGHVVLAAQDVRIVLLCLGS
jgi:hypothetical protein